MARKTNKSEEKQAETQPGKGNLPPTKLTGVNAKDTKTVLVSAVLEVHGQVRFGDGTDVGLTVTETDTVLHPDGRQLQKFIFAGSKRRGVDRRTIHELRDQHRTGGPCYIPNLCCECPICWLYGFTGTTQRKDINAKSRVLYASSVSVEEVQLGRNTHSRNQVDEKTQTTAGAAGIHEEEIIVAGVHFPTYTALVHVLDWEIGVFAHALLENVNSNRYTAASRAQGGIKFAEHDGTPLVIVDESNQGIFPLAAPKIPGWENKWSRASRMFLDAMSTDTLKAALKQQGFTVCDKNDAQSGTADSGTVPDSGATGESKTDSAPEQEDKEVKPSVPPNKLVLEEMGGVITVRHGSDVLMTRYTGAKALGYLREKQLTARQHMGSLDANSFKTEIDGYIKAISTKSGKSESTPSEKSESTGGESDDGGAE